MTTADIVSRLTYTEGALAVCAAQIDGIRRWNDEVTQDEKPGG